MLHDLPLVARWADRCLLVCEGRLAGDGAPPEVLTAQRIQRSYGFDPVEAERFTRSLG